MEKRAGILVSLFFHLAIFSFLVANVSQTVKPNNTPPRLNFILQPVIKAQVPEDVVDKPVLSPSAATVHEDVALLTAEREPAPDVEENRLQTSSLDQRLEIERTKLESEFQRLEKVKEDVKMKLDARLALAGVQRGKYHTAGAARGPMRTIDFKGHPDHVVQDIMKRYDIKIVQKFVDANPQTGFLAYAETDDGVYLNRQGSGYYEVFVLSMTALAKMSQLEHEELVKQGYNLNQTTVEKAVFGIIEEEGEHDLGILEFEARPIE